MGSALQVVQSRFPHGVAWGIVAWLLVVHLGALAAPWTFSLSGLALAIFLHWLTGGIGICLGYHRLLTHRSFLTYQPIRYFLAALGSLAGEGTAIDWVANHRKHHAYSDKEGDPHSPHDGPWWSHVLWLARAHDRQAYEAHIRRWAPDLAKDRVMRWIGAMFLPLHVLFGVLVFAVGYVVGGMGLAWSWLVWGVFLRLTLVLHSTWLVNSASHMWGYRNYQTTDDSRNNWWVALLTYGEGWHNNHHAFPSMAKHGHRWWEIDLTYWVIRLMSACGLAWKVIDYKTRKTTPSTS